MRPILSVTNKKRKVGSRFTIFHRHMSVGDELEIHGTNLFNFDNGRVLNRVRVVEDLGKSRKYPKFVGTDRRTSTDYYICEVIE